MQVFQKLCIKNESQFNYSHAKSIAMITLTVIVATVSAVVLLTNLVSLSTFMITISPIACLYCIDSALELLDGRRFGFIRSFFDDGFTTLAGRVVQFFCRKTINEQYDKYENLTEGDEVIVYIHGFNSQPASGLELIKGLRNNLPNKKFMGLKHQQSDDKVCSNIYMKAKFVTEQISKIYNKTNRKVTLVGHSMGGLISVLALNALGQKDVIQTIDRVITISSPLKGTHGARLIPAAYQMVPNNEFLEIIDKIMIKYPEKLYHISGDKDWLVSMDSSRTSSTERVADDHQKIILKCGHNTILGTETVVNIVNDFINKNSVSEFEKELIIESVLNGCITAIEEEERQLSLIITQK